MPGSHQEGVCVIANARSAPRGLPLRARPTAVRHLQARWRLQARAASGEVRGRDFVG
jgi:hypothetical protein